ncbi:MAG TPA: response regulator [Bacillota bacterium]|nr:response regulator [Bacillota bacterium]
MDNQALKVLLVDDEVLVRDLLKKCVAWERLGATIVGEAAGAGEAMEMVDQLLPDLVFTDICMPAVDGIGLSELIRAKYPWIKVVIITGYEDFDYAKRSIRAGVTEYLLKPINDTEITQVFLNIQAQIAVEKKRDCEYHRLKQQLHFYRDFNGLVAESLSLSNEQTDLFSFYLKIGMEEPEMHHKKVNTVIREVQEYLQKNYADSAISQASVAKLFYLNPSYLSRIFKQAVNQTFVEYLTRIRMEKAMQLLKETDLKAYQIAEMVGIDDPHYFGLCFKKYTGMSVNDYKKTIFL